VKIPSSEGCPKDGVGRSSLAPSNSNCSNTIELHISIDLFAR
jgi:hypothetical protein